MAALEFGGPFPTLKGQDVATCTLEIKAKIEIENINQWLAANKLFLNCDKTCYMIFSPTDKKMNLI